MKQHIMHSHLKNKNKWICFLCNTAHKHEHADINEFVVEDAIHIVLNSEPVHEISNNMVCATSQASDQPAQTRSLIRAFASRLSIL